MVNEIFKDISGIAMAIIGVAILYTLVNPQNRTAQVIGAASTGFSTSLATAMGAQTRGGGTWGF